VYVATRRMAESVSEALRENGLNALLYHGGLNRKDREAIQNQFMDGESEVMVATNAFGMGIDKADIRFVYHYDVCGSLDAYYQEIGRAGRDGEKAEAALFYRRENIGTQRARAAQGRIDVIDVEQVAGALAESGGPLTVQDLTETLPLSRKKVDGAIQRLADSGAVAMTAEGTISLREEVHLPSVAEGAADAQVEDEAARLEKLERMQQYAESKECRRTLLLAYFGEESRPPCGNCDNCEAMGVLASGTSVEGSRREVV
jgi:ATP-dependent DNA helicase RecQ